MMTQVNFTLNLDKFKEDVMPSSLNDVLKSTIVEAYGMMDGKKRYILIQKNRAEFGTWFFDFDVLIEILSEKKVQIA